MIEELADPDRTVKSEEGSSISEGTGEAYQLVVTQGMTSDRDRSPPTLNRQDLVCSLKSQSW